MRELRIWPWVHPLLEGRDDVRPRVVVVIAVRKPREDVGVQTWLQRDQTDGCYAERDD